MVKEQGNFCEIEQSGCYTFPDPKRFQRRLVTIPSMVLAALLVTSLSPFLLILSLLADLVRWSPLATTRALLFLIGILWAEIVGLSIAGWIWLRHGIFRPPENRRFVLANRILQKRWVGALTRYTLIIFNMKLSIEGKELLEQPGPLILFTRHVSVADAVLPILLLTGKRWPRYVLKSELLYDPVFDVVGNRFPNSFVRRGSKYKSEEVTRIIALRDTMSEDESVVIYPEGTRFSHKKRERLIARFKASGKREMYEFASSLKETLPPLREGAFALLTAPITCDLVTVAHRGLETATTPAHLVNGSLIGKTIHVLITRYPQSEIPVERGEQKQFLMNIWKQVDRHAVGTT
jgi:1-acyl-sn-glycerol-3-phosphate acyltransferase